MMKAFVFTVLCLYCAQANLESDFAVIKDTIGQANQKTVNDFVEFCETLSKDYTDLTAKINTLHLEIGDLASATNTSCLEELSKTVSDLEIDLMETLRVHEAANNILGAYDKFVKIIVKSNKAIKEVEDAFQFCKGDVDCQLRQKNVLYDILDEDEVAKKIEKITEDISNAYPEVEPIIKQFQVKVDEIEKEFEVCKSE